MTQLTATKVADELDRTARFLADHGADTTRRVHDLALGASGSSGPGQRNSVSDPTGTAAISPPDRLAGLEVRWRIAVGTIRRHAHAHRLPSQTAEGATTALAGWLRHPDSRPTSEGLRRLHSASLEIDHIIFECLPIDREQAEEELREKAWTVVQAECCQACESPTGESTDPKIASTRIVSGLCRPGCYEVERRQVDRGQWVDRATFIDHVKGGVARGEINRPASPLWRTAVPTIHEGDPAA